MKMAAATAASSANGTVTGASSSSHCSKFASAAGPQSAFWSAAHSWTEILPADVNWPKSRIGQRSPRQIAVKKTSYFELAVTRSLTMAFFEVGHQTSIDQYWTTELGFSLLKLLRRYLASVTRAAFWLHTCGSFHVRRKDYLKAIILWGWAVSASRRHLSSPRCCSSLSTALKASCNTGSPSESIFCWVIDSLSLRLATHSLACSRPQFHFPRGSRFWSRLVCLFCILKAEVRDWGHCLLMKIT